MDVYLSDPAAAKLAGFFEAKGLTAIKEEDRREQWYEDWVAYQAEHGLYAQLLCPGQKSPSGGGFDLLRYARFLELFAYFSPAHGYSLQVTFLGLIPILMGPNSDLAKEAVATLEAGGLFALGVYEKAHGSDLLGNEFTVTATGRGPGQLVANGSKYYIGNCNRASIISILARRADGRSGGRLRRAPFVDDRVKSGGEFGQTWTVTASGNALTSVYHAPKGACNLDDPGIGFSATTPPLRQWPRGVQPLTFSMHWDITAAGHHASGDLAFALESDGNREVGNGVEKIRCTVEGIDDETVRFVGPFDGAPLLDQESIAWPGARQLLDQNPFGAFIGHRNEVAGTFQGNLQMFDFAEIANERAPRLARRGPQQDTPCRHQRESFPHVFARSAALRSRAREGGILGFVDAGGSKGPPVPSATRAPSSRVSCHGRPAHPLNERTHGPRV